MPVYPGAPWLLKFKGQGDDLKYSDWKEEMQGLVGLQELTRAKKVEILLGGTIEKHFTRAKLRKTPVIFQLQAENGLDIPCTSYVVLNLEIEAIKIPGREVVIVKDGHCTRPLISVW